MKVKVLSFLTCALVFGFLSQCLIRADAESTRQ